MLQHLFYSEAVLGNLLQHPVEEVFQLLAEYSGRAAALEVERLIENHINAFLSIGMLKWGSHGH